MIAPLSPGFNLDRYDRELRCPFPSEPHFAPDSVVWRREHAIANTAKPAVPGSLTTSPGFASTVPRPGPRQQNPPTGLVGTRTSAR